MLTCFNGRVPVPLEFRPTVLIRSGWGRVYRWPKGRTGHTSGLEPLRTAAGNVLGVLPCWGVEDRMEKKSAWLIVNKILGMCWGDSTFPLLKNQVARWIILNLLHTSRKRCLVIIFWVGSNWIRKTCSQWDATSIRSYPASLRSRLSRPKYQHIRVYTTTNAQDLCDFLQAFIWTFAWLPLFFSG
jgi:hypothetical protein